MNDYKELIKALRDSAWLNEISEHKPVAKNLRDAADAIERLVKERDAAITDIPKVIFTAANKQNVKSLVYMRIVNVKNLNGEVCRNEIN